MKTLEYIGTHGIAALNQDFGIITKEYPEHGLFVLNYDQIKSPKNEITGECRGLILDRNMRVVRRPFDRFFNYGEQPHTQTHLDFKKAVVMDKVDGSLIPIYHHAGKWHVGTRGTAFGESKVGGFDITFNELVGRAIDFNLLDSLDPEYTHIFEVTAVENRVVTRYSGYQLWYFTSRHNKTGEYCWLADDAMKVGAVLPKTYTFDNVESCISTARDLPDLQEGYVVYQDGIPVCKIKSPGYCAVHLIRGDGLTPNRIAGLVITGETDEYLNYFPEDAPFILPYKETFEEIIAVSDQKYAEYRGIADQKEFALAIKDFRYKGLLFSIRSHGGSALDAYLRMSDNAKKEVLIDSVKR